MAGSGGGGGGGGNNHHNHHHQAAPKILLAKPAALVTTPAKYNRGPPDSSPFLNLLSDSWDFHTDRFLPFLTDNTDFTVVGVIGPPGVGKSTIMNQIYGFDATSPAAAAAGGMLPPFATQSVDTQSLAKHCTLGIEPRITSERIILVDTQPVFSPSLLPDIIRSDGSSTISLFAAAAAAADSSLPAAELAHQLMSIQLGVLLTSICHIVLVVSEGLHDDSMWRLMATVDLLKHSLPDPSSLSLSHPQSSNLGSDKESKDKIQEVGEEYMAFPVFVHTKLHEQDSAPSYHMQVKKALNQYFCSTSFNKQKSASLDPAPLELFFIPRKSNSEYPGTQYESYYSSLWKLRDQVLSMSGPSFSRTVSERDWLKNSGKIWELVKNSSTISDYCKTLQNSGLFRR